MKQLFRSFGSWLRRYREIKKRRKQKYPFADMCFRLVFLLKHFPKKKMRLLIARSWIPFQVQGWIIQGFSSGRVA